METDKSQDSRGREGTYFFYFTLPLPPAHDHSDIYVQLCMWGDYHIFLIATLVVTRLLINEIYHIIELLFDWLMMCCWFKFVCLLIWLGFVTAIWHERNQWTRTCINYHPCITSKPTNQVWTLSFFWKFNSSQGFGTWVCQATVYQQTLFPKTDKNTFF